jgi:LDH2 family malate/lactate/ureidoglycolate dehydrogenase
MPTLPAETLRQFLRDMFHSAGATAATADLVARSLVAANLRGVDSHGAHLAHSYIAQMLHGDMSATASGRVLREDGACLHFDGENGIGQSIAWTCAGHACRLAHDHGVGVVCARESNHFGAGAFWAEKISTAGFIGIVLCNASPLVAPWGAREARLGTNPISVAVPGRSRWLLDMATTQVAANRIFKANNNGEPTIPEGWALDANGLPTTSTQEAMRGLLMPLGGYKGSGLGVMVEMLCGVLSGGAMSDQLSNIRRRGTKTRTSQFFLALDPARFQTTEESYGERAEWLCEHLRKAAPAQGSDQVVVANDLERQEELRRMREGITLAAGTWKELLAAAAATGVNAPATA